jgi:hypothetical protein
MKIVKKGGNGMGFEKHLNAISEQKRGYVVFIAVPKGKYPINFRDEIYDEFEYNILADPNAYVGLYEEDRPEIMQGAAFRLFFHPEISDKYTMYNKTTTYQKRLNESGVKSYFAIKEFYDTVPSSKKKEKEAIEDGIEQGKAFLVKYPADKYEYVRAEIEKDSDPTLLIRNMSFKNSSDYFIDFTHIY